MKYLVVKYVLVLGLWHASLGRALAEPPQGGGGVTPVDVIVLESPCDGYDNELKSMGLHMATLAGASTLLTGSRSKFLLDSLQNQVVVSQSQLLECWSAESAYYSSQRMGGGSAGPAETSRYTSAVDRLRQTVTELPTSLPGENDFDRYLNQAISKFYVGKLQKISTSRNLSSVKQIEDRAREALASVLQSSITCRKSNRETGGQNCDDVEFDLNYFDFILDERIAETRPKVESLNQSLDSLQGLLNSNTSQMQATQQQLMSTLQQIPYYANSANAYQSASVHYASYANYYAYVAYYYAYYGWWGHYHYYIGAAWHYGWWAQYFWQYAAYLQSVVMQLQNSANQLQASLPILQQRAINLNSSIENTKGTIRALPVAVLE